MARLRARRASGHRVLVIDDCEEILTSIARLLRFEGHEVSTVTTVAEGIARARSWEPHLIIVDYYLDDGQLGTSAIEAIRARDEDVQIVLMTGYAGNVAPRQLLRTLEIQGYHDKGDGPDQLLFWVDATLASFRRAERMRRRADALRGVIAAVEDLQRAGADAPSVALRHARAITGCDDGMIVLDRDRGDAAARPKVAASDGRFAGARLERLEEGVQRAVAQALAGAVASDGELLAAPLQGGDGRLGCLVAVGSAETHEALALLASQLALALGAAHPPAEAAPPDEALQAVS